MKRLASLAISSALTVVCGYTCYWLFENALDLERTGGGPYKILPYSLAATVYAAAVIMSTAGIVIFAVLVFLGIARNITIFDVIGEF